MSDTMSIKSGGNIRPSRAIKLSADYTAVEGAAITDNCIGIAAEGSKNAPGAFTSTYLAESGDQFEYYPSGSDCVAELGGTATFGQFLVSAADAQLIAAVGSASEIAIAVCYQGGAVDELVRVRVIDPYPVP